MPPPGRAWAAKGVVTPGLEGYVALVEGEIVKRPAYPVKIRDTTGCGDVFHAGFIYGLLRGWQPDGGLDPASWAALSRVANKTLNDQDMTHFHRRR